MRTARSGRLALLATTIGLAGSAWAAPAGAAAPAPGPALRWREVADTVDQHPLTQQAAARVRGAAGAVWAAQELPNPAFGLSVGEGRPRDGGAARREWGASVELPLEALASRGSRVAAAKASEAGAREDAAVARAQVLRELRRTFVALAHAQAVLEAGQALEAQAAQLAALVGRRAERGEGRPTEVARVEIELERLRGGLARARAAAAVQRQRLSGATGLPVEAVVLDLGQLLPLPPLDELRGRTLGASPALRGAQARVQAGAELSSAERWERLPKVSLGGSHVEELDRTSSTLAATVTVPLWSWNQGRIRQAEAALEEERARLDATTRALDADLAEAWQGCAAGQAAARSFSEQILPRAEGSARTLGRAFELGEAGLLDVLDARRVLLDTRREHLDLLLDVQNACGDLAALAGLELP